MPEPPGSCLLSALALFLVEDCAFMITFYNFFLFSHQRIFGLSRIPLPPFLRVSTVLVHQKLPQTTCSSKLWSALMPYIPTFKRRQKYPLPPTATCIKRISPLIPFLIFPYRARKQCINSHVLVLRRTPVPTSLGGLWLWNFLSRLINPLGISCDFSNIQPFLNHTFRLQKRRPTPFPPGPRG